MKPLSWKEARELESLETTARLRSQNKEAARELLIQMLSSLPRTTFVSLEEVRNRFSPAVRERLVRDAARARDLAAKKLPKGKK